MKKFFTPLLTAALAIATLPAVAQTEVETLNVHHKDGSTTTLNLSTIQDITFGAESPAETQLGLTGTMHEYWGEFSTSPKDDELTYNMMWLEKSAFDQYASTADVVKDDLQYYQELADGYGMTLEQVLSYSLVSGPWTDWMGGTDDNASLTVVPGKQYVIWAYGLNTKGEQTTPFESLTVNSPALQLIKEKPVIKDVTVDGTTINMTVTPDNADRRYITYCLPKSAVKSVDELGLKAQADYVNTLIEYFINGEELQSVLDGFSWKGAEETASFAQNMEAQTEYYVVTAYINDAFTLISPVEWKLVKTGDAKAASAVAPVKAAFVGHATPAAAKAPAVRTTIKRGLMKHIALPIR